MKFILSLVVVVLVFGYFAVPAYAIIFLPAVIIIPIAKIVAIIIGGFSVPALGIGALWSKLFRKSLRRTILSTIVLLLVIGLIIGFILIIENPNRPIF